MPVLQQAGVQVLDFQPANMGFDVDWSDHFADRFHGMPVKSVALQIGGQSSRGEFVITRTGVEGGGVYAISAPLRDSLAGDRQADLRLDLFPNHAAEDVAKRLHRPRGKASLSNHLRKTLGLQGVRAGMVRELLPSLPPDPTAAVTALKSIVIPVQRPRPIAEAISSAGGICWSGLTKDLELTARPGVFVAGEMLDWEAPTGGYLLTASIATGRWAGQGAARKLLAP